MAEQCAFNGGSSDVGSMVQLNVAQSISTCTPGGGLCLAGLGGSVEAKSVESSQVWTENCHKKFDDKNL